MKYETFESIILELKNFHQKNFEKDRALAKAFGPDSYIISDYMIIDNTLKILENELNDKSEFIQWLFWESLIGSNETFTFHEKNKEYLGTIKNVWLSLNNELEV